jgi:hypothetical protein
MFTWLKRKVRLLDFEPSRLDVYNACLSYRHDFGLLDPIERQQIQEEALSWLRAWQKTGKT